MNSTAKDSNMDDDEGHNFHLQLHIGRTGWIVFTPLIVNEITDKVLRAFH